ncbi:unnamed protein product [Penicillium salamii]|nr:unnamed protein product [Penicillium salamii]CAG8403545.1 unnamed protein product [Penicillium salamii]
MADLSVPHNMIAHLPSNGLIGITWGGASLAIVFISARLVVRVKYMKRLLADDYFMLFALVLLVANAILHTLQTPHLYYLGLHPTGADIEYHVLHYLCYEFAISGIFWTILWSVKGSFLALFWMVSDGLPVYRRAWWAVVVFACLAYLGCWVVLVYTCHPPSSYFKYGPGQCGKPIDFKGFTIAISYSTSVDIVTDLLVMSLPLRIIWVAKINVKQKVGLALVFLIGFSIIAAAIVRAVEISGTSTFSDPGALAVWVVVGSLPPFRAIISPPMSAVRSPYGSSGVRPNSYDRNNSAHGKGPSIPVGWGDSPPAHSYKIYHKQDDGIRSQDVQSTEDHSAWPLDRVYPTLSREILARKIKVEQDFVSFSLRGPGGD